MTRPTVTASPAPVIEGTAVPSRAAELVPFGPAPAVVEAIRSTPTAAERLARRHRAERIRFLVGLTVILTAVMTFLSVAYGIAYDAAAGSAIANGVQATASWLAALTKEQAVVLGGLLLGGGLWLWRKLRGGGHCPGAYHK